MFKLLKGVRRRLNDNDKFHHHQQQQQHEETETNTKGGGYGGNVGSSSSRTDTTNATSAPSSSSPSSSLLSSSSSSSSPCTAVVAAAEQQQNPSYSCSYYDGYGSDTVPESDGSLLEWSQRSSPISDKDTCRTVQRETTETTITGAIPELPPTTAATVLPNATTQATVSAPPTADTYEELGYEHAVPDSAYREEAADYGYEEAVPDSALLTVMVDAYQNDNDIDVDRAYGYEQAVPDSAMRGVVNDCTSNGNSNSEEHYDEDEEEEEEEEEEEDFAVENYKVRAPPFNGWDSIDSFHNENDNENDADDDDEIVLSRKVETKNITKGKVVSTVKTSVATAASTKTASAMKTSGTSSSSTSIGQGKHHVKYNAFQQPNENLSSISSSSSSSSKKAHRSASMGVVIMSSGCSSPLIGNNKERLEDFSTATPKSPGSNSRRFSIARVASNLKSAATPFSAREPLESDDVEGVVDIRSRSRRGANRRRSSIGGSSKATATTVSAKGWLKKLTATKRRKSMGSIDNAPKEEEHDYQHEEGSQSHRSESEHHHNIITPATPRSRTRYFLPARGHLESIASNKCTTSFRQKCFVPDPDNVSKTPTISSRHTKQNSKNSRKNHTRNHHRKQAFADPNGNGDDDSSGSNSNSHNDPSYGSHSGKTGGGGRRQARRRSSFGSAANEPVFTAQNWISKMSVTKRRKSMGSIGNQPTSSDEQQQQKQQSMSQPVSILKKSSTCSRSRKKQQQQRPNSTKKSSTTTHSSSSSAGGNKQRRVRAHRRRSSIGGSQANEHVATPQSWVGKINSHPSNGTTKRRKSMGSIGNGNNNTTSSSSSGEEEDRATKLRKQQEAKALLEQMRALDDMLAGKIPIPAKKDISSMTSTTTTISTAVEDDVMPVPKNRSPVPSSPNRMRRASLAYVENASDAYAHWPGSKTEPTNKNMSSLTAPLDERKENMDTMKGPTTPIRTATKSLGSTLVYTPNFPVSENNQLLMTPTVRAKAPGIPFVDCVDSKVIARAEDHRRASMGAATTSPLPLSPTRRHCKTNSDYGVRCIAIGPAVNVVKTTHNNHHRTIKSEDQLIAEFEAIMEYDD